PNSSASGALIVKPDRPQPFGFHVRMTEREAIAAVGRAAVKAGYPKPMPYGSVLLLTTAPKPNSSFEDYALSSLPKACLRSGRILLESIRQITELRSETSLMICGN